MKAKPSVFQVFLRSTKYLLPYKRK